MDEWLETMISEVRNKSTADSELISAMDTIARYIIGTQGVKKISEKNLEKVKKLRTKTCNATSVYYFKNANQRKSRNMVSIEESESIDTEEIWHVIDTGMALIASEAEGKKTHVYFKSITSATTFGTNARNGLLFLRREPSQL